MHEVHKPTRRQVLYGTAIAAGSALLGACSSSSSGSKSGGTGGGPTGSAASSAGNGATQGVGHGATVGSSAKPLAKPASFNEAPSLKGKGLPPVEKRLPDTPYVVPHKWIERGKYGGTLNMPVFGTTGMANASSCHEFFYGCSPTRWLNDGLDVGPGIADKWSSNKDASVWTIHFRKGLKWSDGHPFSVDDILFWWDDMVKPGHDAQSPPEETLSATRHVCEMSKLDDLTLKVSYDAPQPILPEYLACYVKGNIGQNGPPWMYPKHYMKQFHPKYNPKVPKDWDTTGGLWEQKADWLRNPDCPTLSGYKCKSFDNNKGATLERNPYYYAVTQDGDQLPYIDEINFTLYQNAQVIKLQVQQGKFDFCAGMFNQIDLSDVSTLNTSKEKGDYHIELWDSGSGTATMFFLNYDYPEDKYRKLFRDKRFRQAISYAWDREAARKSLYFQTGELTTGTMGPKAPSFHVKPEGPKIYQQWRDAYKDLDIDKGKALLKELGLKDTNNDGFVEFPDGSKLTVEIPYSADISDTYAAADDQLVNNAKKIGLRMVRRPIPPQAYGDQWASGQLMSHTNWEISNGILLQQAKWLMPLENSRWGPLEGNWYSSLGTGTEHKELNISPWKRHPPRLPPVKGGPVDRMWTLYGKAKRTKDTMAQDQLLYQIMKIHIDEGPFFMGTVADYPQPFTVHNDLQNVPSRDHLAQKGDTNTWSLPCPAVYDPECWFWNNPDQHT